LKTIPFLSFEYQHKQIRQEVEKTLMSVYDDGWFISGKELAAFEGEFAAFTGTKYSVGVGNGLDALTISLLSSNIQQGDEVIVPAHTYIATWLAVSRVGGKVIPVEPDDRSFNIDPQQIENVITKKTKAILPVHLYGQACDMSSIVSIAEKYGLSIIEDNAQAQGSSWNGKSTGSWGTVNATSFYPTKNIGALGDGGAITTDDESIAREARQWSNYGFREKNIAVKLGFNSRLDEMQAAVLRIKLPLVKTWIGEKRKIADNYIDQLKEIGDLVLPEADPQAFHTYHLFVIRSSFRDKLKMFLHQQGIETQVHYPIPPHLQKPYDNLNFKKGSFPLTERISETALSLPIWPGMRSNQVDYICDCIRKFFA
jgi:dTDP-4-amino-4,6-dideoxygalactose transaminase